MQILGDKIRASVIDRIDFALRFKVKPRFRWRDEGESRRAAAAILEYLLLANVELRCGPPLPLHGNTMRPAKDDRDARSLDRPPARA